MLGDSESEADWRESFAWLKSRDLRDVDIVVSDRHGGIHNLLGRNVAKRLFWALLVVIDEASRPERLNI